MKYFLDTEFLEGPQKEKFPISLFRKQTPNTIDLISIGIVAEDGREYYAISKDFNLSEAWNRYDLKEEKGNYVWANGVVDGEAVWEPNEEGKFTISKKVYWIRENVLEPIYNELLQKRTIYEKTHHWGLSEPFSYGSMKYLLKCFGKSKKQIAEEIVKFCIQYTKEKPFLVTKEYGELSEIKKDCPEFYAYYSDYDWVVFCWLFGRMIDLPNGFPMFCRDLKQMLVEIPVKFKTYIGTYEGNYMAGMDPYYEKWEQHIDYPKQENEHNALADARWNRKLFDFIQKIKEIN